ncbi:MAG: Mor transcription activator family protein [Burkholderiaceae bacterium]
MIINELSVDQPVADRVMERIVETLCRELGGAQCYFPKIPPWSLARRDVLIASKFDGTNLEALAKEFELTNRQARIILESERVRRKEVRAATVCGGVDG